MRACVDSDVLIEYFDGVAAAADEFSRYSELLISRITWMEVLVGAANADQQRIREAFMRTIGIIELDEPIAQLAVTIRKKHRLKLPDAIVWASARQSNAVLLTRNTKDFRLLDVLSGQEKA